MKALITTIITLFAAFHLCVRSSPPVRTQRGSPDADGGQRRFEFIRFGKRFGDEWNQRYPGTPILSFVEPKSKKYWNEIQSLPSDGEQLLHSY